MGEGGAGGDEPAIAEYALGHIKGAGAFNEKFWILNDFLDNKENIGNAIAMLIVYPRPLPLNVQIGAVPTLIVQKQRLIGGRKVQVDEKLVPSDAIPLQLPVRFGSARMCEGQEAIAGRAGGR